MAPSDDDLVEFLLDMSGDRLYVVVQYGPDTWEFRYVSDRVQERIGEWDDHVDELIDQFRADAHRNRQREQLFDVGAFYCSLHLFDDLLVLHFSQPNGQGVMFGYDPAAAANLTEFVELCLPYIREYALEEIGTSPAWAE